MTTYKILGQNLPTANTETGIYNTPSGSATLIRSINITNTSGTADTFDISLVEDGSIPISVDTYVAVSGNTGNAAAASSTDAITWTARTLPSNQTWSEVSVGNGVFLTVSRINLAATSTTGITWTARTLPLDLIWIDTAFGSNLFVVPGLSSQNAIVSTNGISWTISTLPSNNTWRYISYGEGLFVLHSQSQEVATSPNGMTWTTRTIPSPFSSPMDSVYGNDIFFALGLSTISASSTDSITWTARTVPSPPAGGWRSVAYGNGIFVAASYNNANQTIYSTDAITWTQGTLPTAAAGITWKLNYYNNVFFAIGVGTTNQAATSTNGITWTARSLSSTTGWNSSGAGSYYISSTTENQDYIFKSNPILGNETVTVKAGYTMSENDQVRVRSNNGTSNFHVFGGEI